MKPFPARVRTAIACAAILGPIVIIVIIIFRPILVRTIDAMARLNDARFELDRTRTVLNDGRMVNPAEIAGKEQLLRPILLSGDSQSAALDHLQRHVTELAGATGFRINNVSSDTAAPATPISRLSISINGNGSEAVLANMVAAMEGAVPLVLIDQLSVKTMQPEKPTDLAVEMRVHAYWSVNR